jgi:hypothetical protein
VNDERRPEAPSESSAKRSANTVTESAPWCPAVRGRVVVDLSRFVDDVGFVADGARSALTWPAATPDGGELLVLLGRARYFSPWFWEILADGPRWARIEIRGEAEGALEAVRAVRTLFGEAS